MALSVSTGLAQAAQVAQAGDHAAAIGDAGWSRWQGRVGLSGPVVGADPRLAEADAPGARSSLSLLGDYYFTQSGLAAPGDRSSGGFRATGGLFVGPRSGLWLATPASPSALSSGLAVQRRSFGLLSPAAAGDSVDGGSVPYVGVGYTGLGALRATGGGWGFSADVGLVGLRPRSPVRLGVLGAQGADGDQAGALLQVGVSYSF